MNQVINTAVAAVAVETPRQAWDNFVQAQDRPIAVDGTHRGARHGAFTQSVTVAQAAIEKLQPGFYPVRSLSKEHGVQGWAFRVVAKRMLRDGLLHGQVIVSGQKGDATVLHVFGKDENAKPALVHGETEMVAA